MPLFTFAVAILAGIWGGANLTLIMVFTLTLIGLVIFLYFWRTVGFEELGGLLTLVVMIHVLAFVIPMWATHLYMEHPGSIGSIKSVIFR
jgi:hypothetical protein